MGSLFSFYLLAAIVALFALLVVFAKNPVSAAIFLVAHLFCLAGIYALMGAEFVAAIQIIIYAGAILVLFVFVIMMLNLDPKELGIQRKRTAYEHLIAFVTLLGFFALSYKLLLSDSTLGPQLALSQVDYTQDNVSLVATKLFTQYLWPFELASVLILLAMLVAILIASKPKIDSPKHPSQP